MNRIIVLGALLVLVGCVESESTREPRVCINDAPCPDEVRALATPSQPLALWSVPTECNTHSQCATDEVCHERRCSSWQCGSTVDCPGPLDGDCLTCLDGLDVCGARECEVDADCDSGRCIVNGSRRWSCARD